MDAATPDRMPGRRLAAAAVRAYQTCAFYGVLAAFGLAFLGWSLPAGLLRAVLPRRHAAPLGQRAIMLGFRALLALMRISGLARFDLTALDSLRDEPGLVIAANHPTLLDVLLVASRLPRVVCITKASLWGNPATGGGARLAGYIRNDAPHRLVRAAAATLRGGCQLLIFPEGTRTSTPPLGPFKGGFALMARQAGAPVQTVYLSTNSPYLTKGWPLLKRPVFPLVYRARLGPRFTVHSGAGAFAATLEATMRAGLAAP